MADLAATHSPEADGTHGPGDPDISEHQTIAASDPLGKDVTANPGTDRIVLISDAAGRDSGNRS